MAQVTLKTRPTARSVKDFLARIKDPVRRKDCERVAKIMRVATGERPKMWGSSIVGFGAYHYKGASGREGEWMLTGFSPRKSDLTLYIMPGVKAFPDLLKRLGRHKTGVSCLYLRKLDDVDIDVLTEMVERSVEKMAGQRV